MSRHGQPPQWIWSPDLRQWYWYDARSDEIVFESRQRILRPSHVPRTSFLSSTATMPASATDYSQFTGRQDHDDPSARNNYATSPQSGPQSNTRYQQQLPHAVQSQRRTANRAIVTTAESLSSMNLQNRTTQGTSAETAALPRSDERVTTTRNGPYTSTTNEFNRVQSVSQTEPRENITDPALAQAGIWARSLLLETPGDVEQLFDSYRRRDLPRKYFVLGRVFFVLWAEPQGDKSSVATAHEAGTSLNRYGEPVYSKARRFVVIRAGDNYCSCLPITTYNGRGVAKPGVKKSEHSIIYTAKSQPQPSPGELAHQDEQNMRPDAIRVNADDPFDKLPDRSRLDYGKVYTVHHKLKVRNIGLVHPNSVDALQRQFGDVWNITTEKSRSAPSAAGLRPGGQAQRMGEVQAEDSRGDSDGSNGGDGKMGDQEKSLQVATKAAVQRLIARGYLADQATAAIEREQMRRMRASASQVDETLDSSSEDGDEVLPSTHDRTSSAGAAAAALSHPVRREREQTPVTTRQAASSGNENGAARPAPASEISLRAETQLERVEPAVQQLMVRGYTKEQATAVLGRHLAARNPR